MAEVLTDKEINELLETITVGPSRKSTVKPGTPIKGWKNVETNEVKSYDEWIKLKLAETNNNRNKAEVAVNMEMMEDKLIPIC